MAGMRRGRPVAARGREGAELEVGDGPDRWVPPVGEREREERRRALGGPVRPEAGSWAAAGRKRKGRKVGRGLGLGLDRFVSLFLFLFQIHFKQFFKLFLNQIFYTIFSNFSQIF
jgi:hypothetical protein